MTSDASLLTADEVAAEFRVEANTVNRWAREGKISALTLPGGRLRRFRRADIEAILRGEQPAPTTAGSAA